MEFTGNKSKVIGPFDIPAGQYRVVVTTQGGFHGSVKALEGNCIGNSITFIGEKASISQEAFLESEQCRAVFNISTASNEWRVTIEPLK